MLETARPSPNLFLQTIFEARKPFAVHAALELGIFTAVCDGAGNAEEVAGRCGLAERGARILCDYLTICGFLEKKDGRYIATSDTQMFLNRHSQAYLGDVADFLLSREQITCFEDLAASTRAGGRKQRSAAVDDHSIWTTFARSMAALMRPIAEQLAARLEAKGLANPRVLDIAASHGEYGFAIARINPEARITALDWPPVLKVTRERAARAGFSNRMSYREGDAFEIEFGGPYDIILFPNFLHSFDPPTNELFLKKVRAALASGGKAATAEFVPNEDRISPPAAAAFSLQMLSATPCGDAYTVRELTSM
ncbi:MAG: methyltransferase, partial [Vulcanimicrobiaceae bacterium]